MSDPDSVWVIAAEVIAKENLDEATTIVESYPTADLRAMSYMAIGDALGDARWSQVCERELLLWMPGRAIQ